MVCRGREGGREVGRERGREGSKVDGTRKGREGREVREGGKEGEGGREGRKEGGTRKEKEGEGERVILVALYITLGVSKSTVQF